MTNGDIYYCMSEIGAEILMVISSFIIAISAFYLVNNEINTLATTSSEQDANLILSSAYALFLPLMSYLFSQAKQYNSEGRAQVILIWMVLIEIIRIHADPILTWRLRKSSEQLVRLIWVGFLVCSFAPLHGIRVSLLVLCISFGVYEIRKGIIFNRAKDSYLIGKNPNLIHNYVERIMLQDDLHTTPMNICNYIVMGEQNHEIDVCSNGYVLGQKKSSTEGILTIGRVFQVNSSEDEAFTLAHPNWRDICLSHALAKMLRPRFAKLPIDEAGCRKFLDFVLIGIIDYIGRNRDIQTDENDGARNPTKRVFSIIQEELKYISEFLHTNVPTDHYLDYSWIDGYSKLLMIGNGIYLIYTINKKSSAWLSLMVEKAYNHCFSHGSIYDSMVVKFFTRLDLAITILLFIACYCIQFTGNYLSDTPRWSTLKFVEKYIKDPTGSRSHSSLAESYMKKWDNLHSRLVNYKKMLKAKRTRVYYSSIVDLEAETIFFCIKVDVSTLARLPKWIRRIIPRSSPTVICSINAEEAILKSLRESGGRLTNGETSLKNHGMDHLNWACQPHASTTETILVWHIATTLFNNHETTHANPLLYQENRTLLSPPLSLFRFFLSSLLRDRRERGVRIPCLLSCLSSLLIGHGLSFGTTTDPISTHQNNDPHQEPAPQQNNNPFKEQEVALGLSNYCHYLVKYFPELLPDEVDFTEKMYKRAQKEILDIPPFFGQKTTKEYRCSYALHIGWVESSVVGNGARLAKELIMCAEDGAQVWKMLAEFWAEMMLFIAPSDNVDGHEKILPREELITQLWALLTHAGIITRPKHTRHQDGVSNV